MKRIFVTSLIAMFVSTGVLAQQATEEVENAAQNMTQGAENTMDNVANEAEAATENLAQETEEASENMAQEAENLEQEIDTTDSELATDRPMLRSPAAITREGYLTVEPIELTAENLTGARLYDVSDEVIGEVDKLLLNAMGNKIDQVVLDVGGLLGMGEHEVAVTMEELHIIRSEDGSDLRVYIDATQEELEAQPEYEG